MRSYPQRLPIVLWNDLQLAMAGAVLQYKYRNEIALSLLVPMAGSEPQYGQIIQLRTMHLLLALSLLFSRVHQPVNTRASYASATID